MHTLELPKLQLPGVTAVGSGEHSMDAVDGLYVLRLSCLVRDVATMAAVIQT